MTYREQVVATKGIRLFIKDSPTESADKRWGGLIRRVPEASMDSSWKITRYLRYVIKQLPLRVLRVDTTGNYQLTPLQAMYEQTVVRGSHWASEKLGLRNKEPAFFLRIPVAIALSVVTWSHIDAYYEKSLQAHIVQNVKQNATTYERLIQTDFRYRQIKADLAKGKVTVQQADQQAYWVELAYAEYFKYRDSNREKEQTLSSEMKLIDHFVFKHLKKTITEGVPPMPGFIVPEASIGPLSAKQKLQLFSVNHVLNLRYQLIVEKVNDTALYNQVQSDPDLSPLFAQSFDSEFGRTLQNFARAGKISKSQLSYYLQEDAYWETRFQEWATIGVTKLKKVGDTYTNTPLTLDDIRSEVLAEITSR